MPLIETKGAASAQGFGEFAQASTVANYIEDVFSTYLYTGNGGSQTITNGIDLSTKGGLVWVKNRTVAAYHILQDTNRGAGDTHIQSSNVQTSEGGFSGYDYVSAFNTTGFTAQAAGSSTAQYGTNTSAYNYVSWAFRKQPKFFDVVTYTGNGVAGRTIAHSLGSVPGCIIVKRYSTSGIWPVYHRGLTSANYYLQLESTVAQAANSGYWNNTAPTDTVFTVGNDGDVNGSGISYVAYLFAHNAGGFGLTGTDNVISCGSLTTDGSGNATVNLGYEAQWVLMKKSSGAESWMLFDNMRGLIATQGPVYSRKLVPNLTNAESDGNECSASSTGFNVGGVVGGSTYIYVAIRRGPMKVPTDATKVFTPIAATPSATASASIAVTPDMFLFKGRNINDPFWTEDRLRYFALANTSSAKQLQVNSTAAEVTQLPIAYYIQNANMLWGGYLDGTASIIYNFKRAPSVFDEVCYTGTNANRTINHNLAVTPELIIVKDRSQAQDWEVYSATIGATKALRLNQTAASFTASTYWNNTTPTSSVFTVGTSSDVNSNGNNYVAYLFATCAGVSKVGSYTGTGATQTISCGFTGGARFVLIKRTDSTGSWWVWDTARGMVSGNDKRLALNTTASEVNADWVYTTTGGFQVVTSDAEVNASGGTYIFLAMA